MEESILNYYFGKFKEGGSYLYSGIIWNSIKIYTYFSQYFESELCPEENKIISTEYNNEHNVINISYIIENVEYKVVCPIFHNIDERYIKYLLKCKDPETYILSAMLNDKIDITDLLNKLCGPNGTFYYPSIRMKLKWVIPNEYLVDGFDNLSLIDNEGNDYIYNDLNDILSLKKECNLLPFLNKYEKEKLIKKSPYI